MPFYLIPNIGTDDKSKKFKSEYRILKTEEESPFLSATGYNSLKELKENDPNWKPFATSNPRHAEKVISDEFIIKVKHTIFTPMDDEFDKVSYKLMKHTIMGELSKDIQGIHLISPVNGFIKRFAINEGPDRNGVWVGDIEYVTPERKNKTYIKENSSMFPLSWTPTIFMSKIQAAYHNRQQCKSNPNLYHSITDCGIKVDFVIKNGLMKTVYPIFEKSHNNA